MKARKIFLFAWAFVLPLWGLLAAAQTPPDLQPVPDIPPPPGAVSDPSLEPQITILQHGQDRIEEYRVRGRLYMIKVTPGTGVSYYMVDSRGDGQFRRIDELAPQLMVPLWLIFSF